MKKSAIIAAILFAVGLASFASYCGFVAYNVYALHNLYAQLVPIEANLTQLESREADYHALNDNFEKEISEAETLFAKNLAGSPDQKRQLVANLRAQNEELLKSRAEIKVDTQNLRKSFVLVKVQIQEKEVFLSKIRYFF